MASQADRHLCQQGWSADCKPPRRSAALERAGSFGTTRRKRNLTFSSHRFVAMNLLKNISLLRTASVTGAEAQTGLTRASQSAGPRGAAAVTVCQYVFAILAAS
jgi:hypothetical protein